MSKTSMNENGTPEPNYDNTGPDRSVGNREHLLQDINNPESHSGHPADFFTDNALYADEDYPNDNIIYESFGNEYYQDYTNNIYDQGNTDQVPPKKDKEGSKILFLLQKFTLYETRTHFYIVGSNARETRFRILEIDLTVPKDTLSMKEKGGSYNRHEVMRVLSIFEDENKSNGGFTKLLTAWGIMGFIRFTKGFYMSVITKRSAVALLGGHYVYHIDQTQLVPLCHSSLYRTPDRRSEENRYLTTFQSLDLSKTFYFSYTYDITQTLQTNLVREKRNIDNRKERKSFQDYNEMFVWNQALLKPAMESFERSIRWCLPIIHGFMDQASRLFLFFSLFFFLMLTLLLEIDVYGRTIYVAIIARRSQYFAGARFLKRGANVDGRVANEVETEQIVADINISSFHDPNKGLFNSPRYTSYVQHRGSIPLFWSQDVTNMSPKPPIELDSPDPFFAAAALHFDDMFRRYGPRIRILNLIKRREKHPRETKLGIQFSECIKYLNQFLPEEKQMDYIAWDMSRASRSRDQDVIEFLEKYADETLQQTGFFLNGGGSDDIKVQSGICRTNCIDCLDRTNAAQFVIGKKALGYQLHVLNVISNTDIDYDSDAVDLLTEMFHDHGDTIALQYGGSHLVNTMETYRKINQWSSHSRDLIESIRRFYSNSFIDSQRQDAINLFLGNFKWKEGRPRLWDLSTDYYLHNNLSIRNKSRRSYVKWWTPSHLQSAPERVAGQLKSLHEQIILCEIPEINKFLIQRALYSYVGVFDNYWNEHYKPRLITSFQNLFAFNMNSTLRYVSQTNDEHAYLLGPFKTRKPTISHRSTKNKDKTSVPPTLKQSQQRPVKLDVVSRRHEGQPISKVETDLDIISLVETHQLHERQEKKGKPRNSEMSSTSTRIGALVQASSRFYKKPSFHRLLSEPARLSERFWGGRKGEEALKGDNHNDGINSADSSSIGGSFALNLGTHMEEPYMANDYEDSEIKSEKPIETMLDDLLNPSVPQSEMHIYHKYAGFDELIAPVIDTTATAISSSEIAGVPMNYNYNSNAKGHQKNSYGGFSENLNENFSTTNLKNLNLYAKSLNVYESITEDASFHDQRLYEFSYNLSKMGIPKTMERRQPNIADFLQAVHPTNGNFMSELMAEPCDMGYGGVKNVVSEENVNYYYNWLNGD